MDNVIDINEAPSAEKLVLLRGPMLAGTTDDGEIAVLLNPDAGNVEECVGRLGCHGFVLTKQLVIELAEVAGLKVIDPAAGDA